MAGRLIRARHRAGRGHGRGGGGCDQLPARLRTDHHHGKTGLTARLLPFTVDGLILAASMLILDASRRAGTVRMECFADSYAIFHLFRNAARG